MFNEDDERNYVIRKVSENKLLAYNEEDAKEKYKRYGLDEKDAGDTRNYLEVFPEDEHPDEYLTEEEKESEKEQLAYEYFAKGYKNAMNRLEQKDKDIQVDFYEYWNRRPH